ncbi:MAG: helix-turn-helix transcriptional regulator [Candidatus Azobacteroides sp.]|nr:helix-turn-helix transcriptional regulator [Candidatus Azobacteroides sp.]
MENNFSHKKHYGHNIRCLRDILGIKQDAIAFAMNMTQQNYSNLEQKEDIGDEILERVAKAMNIPMDAIKNFSKDSIINIMSSSLHDNSGSVMYNPTFNPTNKIVELYEKLIAEKNEQITLLKGLIGRK